jgi:hypothetical protein
MRTDRANRLRASGASLGAALALGLLGGLALLLAVDATGPSDLVPESAPPDPGDATAFTRWLAQQAPTPLPPTANPAAIADRFATLPPGLQSLLLESIARSAPAWRGEVLAALPPAADSGLRDLHAALLALAFAPEQWPEWFASAEARGLLDRRLVGLLRTGDPIDAADLIVRHPDAPWPTVTALPLLQVGIGPVNALVDRAAIEAVLADGAAPLLARRVAAALLGRVDLDADSIDRLATALSTDPTDDPDGSVVATVLALDALLPHEAVQRLGGAWIGTLDPHRVRAGLLLLALATQPGVGDSPLHLLDGPRWRSADERTRRVHAAVEWALGRWSRPTPPEALFARMARNPDGTLDLDLLLGRLAAGDETAVPLLLDLPAPPRGDRLEDLQRWEREMALRGLLRRRFVPSIQQAVGDPVGGDPRGIALSRDLATARWWLDRTTLRFDAALRRWTPGPAGRERSRER